MTGNWELVDKPILHVGLLHTWDIHPDFLLSMMQLRKPRGIVNYDFQHDKPYDMARNTVAKNALDEGAEWVLFWDTDVLPPPDAVEKLLTRNQPIIGGLYFRRHPSPFPEVFRLVNGVQFEPLDARRLPVGLIEVDGIGAGFLLVHRRVFEALAPEVKVLKMGTLPTALELPEFFKWSLFEPPYSSEDLYFCTLAKKKGFRIMCDTGISCGHIIKTHAIKNGRIEWTQLEGA